MNPQKRKWIYLGMAGVLAVLFFGLATPAQAVEFVDGQTIPSGTTIDDDTFIAGQRVTVDGDVNGDLFAAGESVTINGTVKGSLAAAGQRVVINGKVEGAVYVGASSLELGPSADIGRNLLFGGYSLSAEAGSQVGRDVVMGGYQALLSGEIARDLIAGLGALEIDGKVGGDVKLDIGEPSEEFSRMPFSFFTPPGVTRFADPGLRVGDRAEIGGSLTYTSVVNQAAAIESSPAGGVVFQTPMPGERPDRPSPQVTFQVKAGRWILERIREFFTLLLLGALAVWLLPKLLRAWSEQVKDAPLPALGWGFIVLIVGYAGAALLALLILAVGIFMGVITLGGLASTVFGVGYSALGLTFTAFVLMVSYGSKLIVAFMVGKFALQRLAPQLAEHRFWPMLVGVILYVLVRSIPVLGWLIGVAVTLLGLGAVWLAYRSSRLAPAPLSA